ncbi:hypothetical protein ABVT39_004156 [Epinephelus coioides]
MKVWGSNIVTFEESEAILIVKVDADNTSSIRKMNIDVHVIFLRYTSDNEVHLLSTGPKVKTDLIKHAPEGNDASSITSSHRLRLSVSVQGADTVSFQAVAPHSDLALSRGPLSRLLCIPATPNRQFMPDGAVTANPTFKDMQRFGGGGRTEKESLEDAEKCLRLRSGVAAFNAAGDPK